MIDGMPLVDVHIHAARLESLKVSWERWVFQRRSDGDPADIYEGGVMVPERFGAWMDREGVDVGLLFAEYSPRVTGIQPVEDLLPLIEHDPERLRLVANINPHLHHPAADELERQLGLGAVAVKIHPVHGGFPANTRELYPAYRLCQQEGVPVVFHAGMSNFTGASNRFADPLLVEDVANDFPGLTIVLAHGGRGWWYEAAAFLALMRDNVWIDIGGLPPGRLRAYFRNHDLERLAQRFMFGSDWPGCPGIKANAQAVLQLGFDRTTLERIFFRNAVSVFRLGGPLGGEIAAPAALDTADWRGDPRTTPRDGLDEDEEPSCPWCDSTSVERIGGFGPQLMTAQYRCLGCGSPFGRIRQRGRDETVRAEP